MSNRKAIGTNMALLRLMQLTSPSLPVGAYAYSQGLEYSVHAGWITDETSAENWIAGLMTHSLASVDVPILARFYQAWGSEDQEGISYWSHFLRASRESRELQEEDRHMGSALARLLTDLDISEAECWINHSHSSFINLFALAAVSWDIPVKEALYGYLWAWAENQVAAAVKLIPLGQTAGQRVLSHLIDKIPVTVEQGTSIQDDDIGFVAPGLAIGSALHETQYSRLFRS